MGKEYIVGNPPEQPSGRPYFKIDGRKISDDGGTVIWQGNDIQELIDLSNGVLPHD